MITVYVIKRDIDASYRPAQDSYWCGKNGGGWSGFGVTEYATRKHAEAALKRNAKSEWTFKRGNAYIVEVEAGTLR